MEILVEMPLKNDVNYVVLIRLLINMKGASIIFVPNDRENHTEYRNVT